MGSTKHRQCKEEFAQRGDALDENDVRSNLKTDGKFATINAESGMYSWA
jgi:hypothetical protein